MKKLGLGAVFLGVLLGGCATIMSTTTQDVSFSSSPESAEVRINGISVGLTPVTVKVKRDKNTMITVQKDGYQEERFQLGTEFNPWFMGNVITGGLLGSTTDVVSGATVEYSPSQYHTTLKPVTPAQAVTAIDKSAEVKRFVLVNFADIGQELATGSGENLSALLIMLAPDADKHPALQEQLKNYYFADTNPPVVAENIAQLAN